MRDTNNLVHNVFAGIAVGDALGFPVENMLREEILEFNGGKELTGFVTKHRVQNGITTPVQIATTSDDWQLSQCVAESLISQRGFNLHHQAFSHCQAAEVSTFGWGSTTRNSIKEISKYFKTLGKEGRNPILPPPYVPMTGGGNGVAMKVMPLVLHCYLSRKFDLATAVWELGLMTHCHPSATVGAYVLAAMAYDMLCGQEPTLKACKEHARVFEKYLLPFLREHQENHSQFADPPFSWYLEQAEDSDLLFPVEDLIEKFGNSCLAVESVVFSILVILRNLNNVDAGMLEAVNAGGDSDTNSSMVGAVLGINNSSKILLTGPKEFQQMVETASKRFADSIVELGGKL